MNKVLIFAIFSLTAAALAGAASFEKSGPFCKSGSVYVAYTFFACPECDYEQLITECPDGCTNGQCNPCNVEDCDSKDGYLNSGFCKGNEIYKKYRNYECTGGKCQYTETEKKVDECFFGLCSNGACQKCDVVECDAKDGYYGSPSCELDTVRKQYRDYSCSGSQCAYIEKSVTIEKCPDKCESGRCVSCNPETCDAKDSYTGSDFCKTGNIYRKHRDYFCAGTACEFVESEKTVETCLYGCSSAKCTNACEVEECDAKDGYAGSKFCKNSNVYRVYRDYSCGNIVCGYAETEKRIDACSYGCLNGGCLGKEKAQTCTDKCAGDVWKYGGVVKNNACEYSQELDCGTLDGEYGARFCKGGKAYVEYRDYSCTAGGCQYSSTERKVADICDFQFAQSAEKEKNFEFSTDALAEVRKEVSHDSITVSNGLLFGNNVLEISAEKPGNLSFYLFETNGVAPLHIKVNGRDLRSEKLVKGFYAVPVAERGIIKLETGSSGLLFWAPSMYKFYQVKFSYPEAAYEGSFEFTLSETQYLKFTKGIVTSEADVLLNGYAVKGSIERPQLKAGKNTVRAVSISPAKVKISLFYLE